eukprot:1909618-Rhodomonas_salina.1
MPHVFDWDARAPSPSTLRLFWRNHNQQGRLDEWATLPSDDLDDSVSESNSDLNIPPPAEDFNDFEWTWEGVHQPIPGDVIPRLVIQRSLTGHYTS